MFAAHLFDESGMVLIDHGSWSGQIRNLKKTADPDTAKEFKLTERINESYTTLDILWQ